MFPITFSGRLILTIWHDKFDSVQNSNIYFFKTVVYEIANNKWYNSGTNSTTMKILAQEYLFLIHFQTSQIWHGNKNFEIMQGFSLFPIF